jgi:hypothetical protein
MATLTLADKMPNCTHFYKGLTQEEIDSVVVQKYFDSETDVLGTIAEVPKFSKNQYVEIGMTFE